MAKKDAQITVGADASAVERAMNVAKTAAKSAAIGMGKSFGAATRGIVESLSDVALAAGKVNFSSQHEQVRAFEGTTARMAVSMGKDLSGLRKNIDSIGVSIGKRPQEVAAWASEIGRLSYDFDGAVDSATAMFQISSKTGRSIDDYHGLAVTLSRMGVAGKDTANAVGVLAAQADKLGTVGGVAALTDQFDALGESVTHFQTTAAKMGAFIGTLGKGLDPVSASRVQQQALGYLQGDPRSIERFLGHHVIDDKTGKIQDPAKIYQEIYAKASKRYRDPETLRAVLMNNFGPELGLAVMRAGKSGSLKNVDNLVKLAPVQGPATAAKQLLETDAGKRQVADAKLADSANDLFKSSSMLGRAADALQRFAGSHPIASTFGSTVVTTAASLALGKLTGAKTVVMGGTLLSKVGGVATGSIATGGSAVLSGLGALAPVLAPAGAGLAGFAVGAKLGHYLLDKKDESDQRKLAAADEETKRLKAERDRVRALRAAGQTPSESSSQNVNFSSEVKEGIKAGMSNVRFTIVNATGGPVDIVNGVSASETAGARTQ